MLASRRSDPFRLYRGLEHYSDLAISTLDAQGSSGERYRSVNRVSTAFSVGQGARISTYLGLDFTIDAWRTVTSALLHAGRYAVTDFRWDRDWHAQLALVGGFLPSEHPGLAAMMDGRTNRHETAGDVLGERRPVLLRGRRASQVSGTFSIRAQGMVGSVPGHLWFDEGSGLIVRAEYDVTLPYQATFGPAESARLAIDFTNARPAAPGRGLRDTGSHNPARPNDVRVSRPDNLLLAPDRIDAGDDGTTSALLGRRAPRSIGDSSMPRLLFFWATWCPASARAIAQIDRLASLQGKPFDLVAVSVDAHYGQAVIRAHLDTLALTLPAHLDWGNRLSSAYRVVATPSCFLVDREGMVRLVDVGEVDDLVPRYLAAAESI